MHNDMITSSPFKATYYIRCLYLALLLLPYTSCNRNDSPQPKAYSAADAQQIRSLNNRWYALRYSNPDSARYILHSLRSIETKYSKATGAVNYYAGMTFLLCNIYRNTDSGKIYMDSARLLLELHPNPTSLLQSKTCYTKGVYYNAIQEYDSASACYLQALKLLPKGSDTLYANGINAALSTIAFNQENYELAYHYFDPILKEALQYKNPPRDIAALINGFSICINIKGPLREKRRIYLFAAKKLADSLQVNELNGWINTNLATYYFDKEMGDSGTWYSRKAIEFMNTHPTPYAPRELPYLLMAPWQIKTGDYAGANATLKEMLQVADTAQIARRDLINYYQYSYQVNSGLGNDKAALSDLEHYKNLQDKVMQDQKSEQLTEHEKQMKRLDNAHMLRAKDYKITTQRNYLILAIIIAGLILTASAWLYYYRHRKQVLQRKYWAQLQKERDLEHQNRLHEERNRISREMHDDLGTTLTSTVMAVELVQHFPENKKYLDDIRTSADNMYQKINEIVWNLNIQNDNVGSLNNYMIRFAKTFLSRAGLTLTWEEEVDNEETPVAGHQRRVLYLAFKELINNLVKHAGAAAVHIELHCRQSSYRLIIEDDGKGIDPARVPKSPQDGHGYGLGNILRNITGIDGRVTWTTPEGHSGTRVVIEVDAIS